jgi:hypothetical protein
MNRQSKFVLALAGLALLVPQAANAKGPDPKLWDGAWHLNIAKSKFPSGGAEQSETRTYSISADKVTMKSSSKDKSGKAMNFSYSAGWDGKMYPMVGNPRADQISLKMISAREFSARSALHGKVTVESTATVSADGKHLTLTRHMLALKGAPTDVLEFDR